MTFEDMQIGAADPQAPTLIRAPFLPIFGHGTLRMTGWAPGPS